MRISDWSSDVCSSDLLVLEAVDDLGAVEAEVFGVAAHEAAGIGRPGQVLVLAALYGVEIGVADAQHLGDGPEVLAELLARPAEGVGDRLAGQILQIGRASCREGVCKTVAIPVEAVSTEKIQRNCHSSTTHSTIFN